ncbi:MAG: sigma-54 dependent transcriptional regulator [Acidobacteria bacterium]|nr:sigma-54 dependent transcriptional regulator [Acidobacteriota bacterium]
MESGLNMLIIDEDLSLYDLLKHSTILDKYNIYFSDNADDMLNVIKNNNINVIITDVEDDDEKAHLLLSELKSFDSLLDVIIVGDPLPSGKVLEMINLGAKDYLEKPLQVASIHRILKEISDKKALRRETFQLEKQLEKKYIFHGIIGKSPYMLEVYSLIEKIAKYFSCILVTGETGTGKEMVARAIHELGETVNPDLVICDCSSIPDNLFESELFGYVKGAFTGADRSKKGLFEEAHKGIIFLDELGEVPLPVQAKLLRVMEYQQFRPLGSNETKKVDVKVITATNRDLRAMVEAGTFRQDLFHRLNKVEISLPPLRDRREDIPLLVRQFLNQMRKRMGKNIKGISRQVQKMFLQYEWPGNVRELKNVLESAALVSNKDFIDLPDLPQDLQKLSPKESGLPFINHENLSTLDELEKEYIQYLLKVTEQNLRKTASILNISRTTLYNKLKKFSLRPN